MVTTKQNRATSVCSQKVLPLVTAQVMQNAHACIWNVSHTKNINYKQQTNAFSEK